MEMPNVQYLAVRLFFEKEGPEGSGRKTFRKWTQIYLKN
jgi:hypothetical protein